MANDVCIIQRATLEAIADAIRQVKKIQGQIPVGELDDVLLSGKATTTAPLATAKCYKIRRQTLIDLANVVRTLDGTTADILVADLEEKILGLNMELSTSAILGRAILGLAILGTGGLPQLDTPVIELVVESEDDDGKEPDEPDEPTLPQLDTPVIELVEIEDGGEIEPEEPDEPTLPQLDTPVIELVVESEDDDDGKEPDEPDEPTISKLETPVIKLIDVTDGAVKVTFDNWGYIDFEGNIINEPGSGKKYSDIVAISDLANGPDGYCVQDFDTIYTEYPKVLFFAEPSLSSFIKGFAVTEIGSKDRLTVAEIKALATNVSGAKYVAFNSDYEEERAEDHVYIVQGAPTFKPETPIELTVLDTPVIYLEGVEEEQPDEPTIIKLATPVIELVVESEDDGGEDEPTIIQLTTPVIEIVEVEDTGGEDSGDDNGSGDDVGSGGVISPTPGGDATEDQM